MEAIFEQGHNNIVIQIQNQLLICNNKKMRLLFDINKEYYDDHIYTLLMINGYVNYEIHSEYVYDKYYITINHVLIDRSTKTNYNRHTSIKLPILICC